MKRSKGAVPLGLPADIKGFYTHALACYDGQYQLFLGERRRFWQAKSILASSDNLLDWRIKKPITSLFSCLPAAISSGCFVNRNGKTAYLYRKRTLFSDTVRLISTSNFARFAKHPVAVLTAKSLPKKARGLSAPRVVKSGDFYYMTIASRMRKGGMILLYKSPNLTDWQLCNMISCDTTCRGRGEYPALIQVNGKHLLVEQRVKNGIRMLGYREGIARLEEGCFTALTEFAAVSNTHSPRLSTLPDGRVILIDGLNGIDGGCRNMAIPKEVAYHNGVMLLSPVRELYTKRRNERAASLTATRIQSVADGISGKSLELNVIADMSSASELTVMAFMSGCRGLSICINNAKGTAELHLATLQNKKRGDRQPLIMPINTAPKIDVQLILLPDRFECFINGGEVCWAYGLDTSLLGSQIGFQSDGAAQCSITAYDL